MKIGDLVKYMGDTNILGLIIDSHDTKDQYGWPMVLWHVQWVVDPIHAHQPITHEISDHLEVLCK